MRLKGLIVTTAILAAAVFLMVKIGFTDTQEPKPKLDKELKWLKYDEGLKLAAEANKPVMVDFYTNWCGFCKKMDRETFTDEDVKGYLGEKFVIVKVNAESNDMLATSEGTISERQLARSFGVRGYPTYSFLKPNGERINDVPGYKPPDAFLALLKYFGDGHYQSETWKEYVAGLREK